MGAIVKQPPDRFALAIAEAEQAIEAVKVSTDPIYVLKPWRREELISELEERIASVKREQQRQEQAAAEKAEKARKEARFARLAPKREALAERWNACRAEIAAVITEANALQRLHLQETDRPALSETPTVQGLVAARLEAVERWLIFRPE